MHSVPNGSGTSFYCLARRRRRVLSYCGSVSSKSGGGVTDVDDLRLSVRDNDGDDVLKDPWKEKKNRFIPRYKNNRVAGETHTLLSISSPYRYTHCNDEFSSGNRYKYLKHEFIQIRIKQK